MRRAIAILTMFAVTPLAAAQEVVDRIVARVEDDIITLSEVRELGRFQQLMDGRAASDDGLLSQLVEQWVVSREAAAARFPRPTAARVDGELKRLEKQFPSLEAFRASLRQLELSESAVRRLLEQQLYLAWYLDYKFRPATHVDAQEIEQYYRQQLAPQLAAQGQSVPSLEQVRDQIRELLTQHQINQRAARWLDEAKSRLRIEFASGGNAW